MLVLLAPRVAPIIEYLAAEQVTADAPRMAVTVGKQDLLYEMARLGPVILIVEDEFLLRMDSAEVIENAGFEVIQAASADEAIAIVKARPNIHVVFTDIQMPGSMDGLKLARFIRNRWPPIKIVATSGRVAVDDGDLPDGGVFLPKPYRSAQVLATLRALTTPP
jgi:two-component system, response regulator PdtaR